MLLRALPIATGATGRGAARGAGSPHLRQRALPATLEFAGNETVVRIDAIELPFRQGRSVSGALDLAFGVCAQRVVDLLPGLARA